MCLFILCFGASSHVPSMVLELLSMTLTFAASCPRIPSAGVTDVCHHPWFHCLSHQHTSVYLQLFLGHANKDTEMCLSEAIKTVLAVCS